jgi:UDP-2,3-diacylglucosamine hydrolase
VVPRLALRGRARLISDLHLQPETKKVNARFTAFLRDCAKERIAHLFILGDLFEYWIGDDCSAHPFVAEIAGQLRQLSDSGTALHFIAGNRDFLLGAAFAAQCGMELLADEAVVVGAGGTAILLMHGDTLCTDDVAYQQFRSMVRAPQWQVAFLARALPERLDEVARLRERSREAMQEKSAEIMDVNAEAVQAAFARSGCRLLVHGHTHRPGCQTVKLGSDCAERWVLSDWTETRADALEIDVGGLRRIDLTALN